MKKCSDVVADRPAHSGLVDGITRVLVTIAMGIYATCALAVAVDWGLESVVQIEDPSDSPS